MGLINSSLCVFVLDWTIQSTSDGLSKDVDSKVLKITIFVKVFLMKNKMTNVVIGIRADPKVLRVAI